MALTFLAYLWGQRERYPGSILLGRVSTSKEGIAPPPLVSLLADDWRWQEAGCQFYRGGNNRQIFDCTKQLYRTIHTATLTFTFDKLLNNTRIYHSSNINVFNIVVSFNIILFLDEIMQNFEQTLIAANWCFIIIV